MKPTETIAVRMDMGVTEAERAAEIMLRAPADVVERLNDQLWLVTVFVEQRRRTAGAERALFTVRANRLLELLDPQELPCSDDGGVTE